MKLNFQKTSLLVIMFLGSLLLNACDNTWEGCPEGYYPDNGECQKGCPSGTSNQDGTCMPTGSQPPVDGDFFVDGDDTVIDGDTTDGDVVDGATDGDTTDGDVVVNEDTIIANGITLNVVTIPAGSFEMGCVPEDENCLDNEVPRHTVNVPEFKMTQSEITTTQFAVFLSENGTKCFDNECACFVAECSMEDNANYYMSETDGVWSVNSGYESNPFGSATLHGARGFCNFMGGRLPSEAEWEYAARAGGETIYYCGNNPDCLETISWNQSNSDSQTHPVCTKGTNPFGLCDMLGNVWEWCDDCKHANYMDAPTDGSVWPNSNCTYNIARGGSKTSLAQGEMRTSNRGLFGYWGGQGMGIGIRCAFDAKDDLVDINWLSISGGSFEMGCSPNDDICKASHSDEQPIHTVNVPDFEMLETEVTNDQYAKFLNANGNTCDDR